MDEKVKEIKKTYSFNWFGILTAPRKGLLATLVRGADEVRDDIQYLLSLLEERDKKIEELEKSITIKTLENAKGAQILSNIEARIKELEDAS